MQEMRETILRVRKPQWLLTLAEREDEANPLAPAQLSALNTVGQHEKEGARLMQGGASLRKRCRKKTKRYSAFAAFCFFAVATIVFTPLTASTIASTNSSTARIACSTGASAMPLVMMVVTFW